MKKFIILGAIAAFGLAMTSCDHFLDKNRKPLTSIENTPEYWNNPDNCQLQVDRFLGNISSGYGSGGQLGNFYSSTRSDDQVGAGFVDWEFTFVPSDNGNWTYGTVRGCNYIINNVEAATGLNARQKANFIGIAKLVRADHYFYLVRNFGDVVWEDQVIDPADEEMLYQGQTPRDEVMDHVFADLDAAIAGIEAEKSKTSWSKDQARALKSWIALYEGTYCKYRTQADNGQAPDLARANKYLEIAASTAKELIDKYGFEEGIEGYHSIYNSVWGGGTGVDGSKLKDFTAIKEIIFGRQYDSVNLRHSTIARTASSTTTSGMSLDAFKSYLFLDGKPSATTSYNTSLEGENCMDGDIKAYSIAKVLENRDKRLSIATDPYVYYKGLEWSRVGTTGLNSSSGFGVAKYDNVALPVNARGNDANNYTSAPIFWTSQEMCIYMEAKAELGTITDADLDLTYNKLNGRGGIAPMTVAQLSAINDPANNMGVSSLIWEIRRCRRAELMFDGYRYWDLVRWHQLELLDSEKHPDVLRGAYVGNADVKPATVDADGYIRPYPTMNRVYQAKYYLQPIPTGQLDLYEKHGQLLKQNPGWK